MKGLERRQIKKSLFLPLLHLTSSIFSSVRLTFALCLVLCCAGTTSVCSFDIITRHEDHGFSFAHKQQTVVFMDRKDTLIKKPLYKYI
jgi:hypothetical protein